MPLRAIGKRLADVWRRDIWTVSSIEDPSPRGRLYALMRVVSITWGTFLETKSASRAADLSFSLMLGLGPLIAIVMLVASKVLGQRDPDLAVHVLNRVISFVAPQLNQYESLGSGGSVAVNPDLVRLINGFIRGAQSGTAGLLGALSLVLVVLLLFKSVEDVFNEIWGVRRGRSLLRRLGFYGTILVLGGILFLATVALVGAGTFVQVMAGRLPYGSQIIRLLQWTLPSASFVLLVAVLAAFYRVIPNTRVRWGAALAGALVVAALLTTNNYLQFLYLKRVLITKSLFGSLGIIPVLMFGLYIFWLFVLIGGQISYAVQNVHARNSQLAWRTLSATNRERLSLAVLMAICRRYHAGRPALSLSELAAVVKLPEQVLNECLNQIADLGFVVASPQAPGDPSLERRYQPARPLNRITLFQFKSAAENAGADLEGDLAARIDPIVREFGAAIERLGKEAFFSRSVEELLSAESAAK